MVFGEYFPCDTEADKNEKVSSKDIRNIYEKIEDEDSRYIFENRLMYSLTGDYEYMRRIIMNTAAGKMTDKLLKGKLYIWCWKKGKNIT